MLILLAMRALGAPITETPDWEADRTRADAQVGILTAMVDEEMYVKALQVLGEIRAEGADDPRLDVLQARALHATGMSSQALRLLEERTRRSPRSVQAWSALGVVRADTGDLPGAAHALERARRIDPKDADTLNNLGYVKLSSGDAEAAVRLFEAALMQDPASVRTRNNLGFALARLERDSAALEAFRAAGSEADARYNLAVACTNRGDRPNAIAQLHAALEANSSHAAATAALKRLLEEAP
jgi:Flp pilus assembly protein TadD